MRIYIYFLLVGWFLFEINLNADQKIEDNFPNLTEIEIIYFDLLSDIEYSPVKVLLRRAELNLPFQNKIQIRTPLELDSLSEKLKDVIDVKPNAEHKRPKQTCIFLYRFKTKESSILDLCIFQDKTAEWINIDHAPPKQEIISELLQLLPKYTYDYLIDPNPTYEKMKLMEQESTKKKESK